MSSTDYPDFDWHSRWVDGQKRIAELEAEVKRWQQQSNKHYLYSCELDKTVADLNAKLAPLEGRSAADHMKYQGELETKVVKLTKQLAELRSGYECYCPNCAAKLKVSPKSIALLESQR